MCSCVWPQASLFFSAAYQAEVIRGGINSVPKGRLRPPRHSHGLLADSNPHCSAAGLPGGGAALVNSFIAIFKDTSLVTIVSMYELFGSLRLASETQSGAPSTLRLHLCLP